MVKRPVLKKSPEQEELFLHEMALLQDPRTHVLDFGAGAGSFDYRSVKAIVVALDQTVPANAPPLPNNATFIHGNTVCLPFAAESFDLVVANFVFEHFWTPDLMLLEIERVLKPEGRLYLSIPNAVSLEDKLYRLFYPGEHRQKFSFHSFLNTVYETTGFKLLSFADWPAGYTWLNPPPAGHNPKELLLRVVRLIRPLLQRRARKDSNFIFLFQKAEKTGFRLVTHICPHCGGGVTMEIEHPTGWICSACNHLNR